jgi:hypothetical protein
MTELAVYEPNPNLPARVGVPGTQDFDSWVAVASDVIKLAGHIFDTPFVPDGLRGSAPAVAAAILAGREMGLGPMTSLANIDVIKGKPSQKAVLMRAMVLSRGHKWVDVDVSDVRVVIKGCRRGEADWTEVTFTAQHAKIAGIDLGKYPADKLYARATSRLARRKFADVIMGMPYSDDELEDGVTEAGEVTEPAAEPPKDEKPRTVQRRQRPAAAATEAKPAAAVPAVPDDLPPLPGEDEPPPDDPAAPGNPDEPGTATVGKAGQLTALWATMSLDFEFTRDDKAQARQVCEDIIGRKLTGGTTGNLSYNEARTVLDTLANWRSVAEQNGEPPRSVMVAMLAEMKRTGQRDAGPEAGDG